MKRLLSLLLLVGCTTSPSVASTKTSLEGRFLLAKVSQPTSTSPQMFPAQDWAGGLTLVDKPSAILLQQGKLSASGILALSGHMIGEVKGQQVQFTVAEEDGGTRLEIQFQGTYNASTESIEGQLNQRWELVGDEEGAGVTLSGQALFVRRDQ